jgi:hypothetical protein
MVPGAPNETQCYAGDSRAKEHFQNPPLQSTRSGDSTPLGRSSEDQCAEQPTGQQPSSTSASAPPKKLLPRCSDCSTVASECTLESAVEEWSSRSEPEGPSSLPAPHRSHHGCRSSIWNCPSHGSSKAPQDQRVVPNAGCCPHLLTSVPAVHGRTLLAA